MLNNYLNTTTKQPTNAEMAKWYVESYGYDTYKLDLIYGDESSLDRQKIKEEIIKLRVYEEA